MVGFKHTRIFERKYPSAFILGSSEDLTLSLGGGFWTHLYSSILKSACDGSVCQICRTLGLEIPNILRQLIKIEDDIWIGQSHKLKCIFGHCLGIYVYKLITLSQNFEFLFPIATSRPLLRGHY